MKIKVNRFFIIVLLSFFIASCSVLPEKEYPKKRFYSLDIMRVKGNRKPASPLILKVRNFKISPTFNGRNFTHKVSRYTYDTDFYNAFFIPVQLNIMELAENWLSNSDIFSLVVSGRNAIPSDLILEANVLEIYADHSKNGKAKAVLRMKFFVTSTMNPDSRLFFAKEYQRIIPLQNRKSITLIKGWNLALKKIFEAFESDLRRLAKNSNGLAKKEKNDDGESTIDSVKESISKSTKTIIKGAEKTSSSVKEFIQDIAK